MGGRALLAPDLGARCDGEGLASRAGWSCGAGPCVAMSSCVEHHEPMSHRLQVLVPPALDARIRKAAQRSRLSKGEWVRRAIEAALEGRTGADPLSRLAALGGPTANIEQMIAESAREDA